MRRITAIVVLLLFVCLPTVGRSIAAPTSDTTPTATPTVTTFNGYCFTSPFTQLVSCPVSPTPTRVPIVPNKQLTLSGAMSAPAGTTQYQVQITSQLACFALNEPVFVSTLGNPNAAAITPLFPTYMPSPGSHVTLNVEQNENQPGAGTARALLEVFNAVVGPEGLDLKAVWAQEGIERVVNVVPPAPPTPTPTPLPGQPTPTNTPVTTPGATPTATVTPTPIPSAFTVQACVQPRVLNGHSLGGQSYTLYGHTTPGAVCIPYATDSSVLTPSDIIGQVAGPDGLVVFPLFENSSGDYGTASVTCTLNGQTQTGLTYFFVLQKGQVQAALAPGCVPASNMGIQAYATVSNLNPPQNSNVTIGACFFSNGAGVAGVPVTVVAHLTTGNAICTAVTDANGRASCTINVDGSAVNTPVGIGVFFTSGGTQYFVPAAITPIL